MNVLFFTIGLVIGALLVGFVLKSKNSSLHTQIDLMKEQEAKNDELRNKQFEMQINALKSELQNATEKLLRQREESLVRNNSVHIEAVLGPLKNEIEGMKKSMVDNIKTSSENKASLEKAIEELMKRTQDIGNDAHNLAKALKNESKTQGNWGELILENILEKSGLSEGEHYEKQSAIKDAKGNSVFHDETGSRLIPDIVVHYPDNKDLVIDSKVSLTAFVDYCNAADESAKSQALRRHLLSLRNHYKELQKKSYSSYIKAPRVSLDYVVMFVPNESAMQLALYEDASLWREAFENGVFITSEQNLLALLRMIQLAWSQVKQARNQQEVFDEVNKLLDRVGEFVKRYEDLGKKIESLQVSYEETRKKLYTGNQSVVKTAGKLIDMGGKSEKLIANCGDMSV
ncbi:MAG: DNA recombination protein RmuC [Bacteroidales bacterium]|nr:DNA recombination protein RmuC [Bacteroidales bacterium]